jgi:1,4-alpha-glucan branching enzyme
MTPRGALALVLHTHMPYVEGGAPWPPPDTGAFLRNPEGFGTWPFGEEWLWEAIATSYLPLVEALPPNPPLTLSLTPVLCDQLEAPGAIERCIAFLEEIRPESHARDIAAAKRAGAHSEVVELERSAAEYADAAQRLRHLDLLDALGERATWTSAATHAVLPLLVSDEGVELQVKIGIDSHRRRFGEWGGGFWLPECAHAPWLDPLLEEEGVRATCVELTNTFGLNDERHLTPLETDAGTVLWPVDRATMALVWSDSGYPSSAAYRDYHNQTGHDHRAHRTDGGVYDPGAANAQAREDARDFVARVRARVANGGMCVCALDTELLGHWWYEGVVWLQHVLEEAERQDLALTTLDDALETADTHTAPQHLPTTSWGTGGDLRTWSGPAVADIAWQARAAELAVLRSDRPPSDRALRELLALQSSDWAFLASAGTAGDYPRERAAAHAAALDHALAGDLELQPRLRSLAPGLSRPR